MVANIDPGGRPTVTAGGDHCFCTCRPFVRPSIHPHFSKQNKFQAKTMFATGETVGLAEWIIDDSCLVDALFSSFFATDVAATTLFVSSCAANKDDEEKI